MTRRRRNSHRIRALALLLLLWSAAARAQDIDVYRDALGEGWENWSWDTTVNLAATSPVHGATRSLAATYTAGWAGLYLNHTDIAAYQVSALQFWINGGAQGGQKINVTIYTAPGVGSPQSVAITAPAAGTWAYQNIPISSFGAISTISGIVWQENNGAAPFHTFYLDDVILAAGTEPTPTPAPAPALSVNAAAAGQPISPDIYGMNFCDEALAAELRLPVRRWGGNATTRYNYLNDTANHASDWYFENYPEDNDNPAALPDGSIVDRFVEQDRRTGTRTILTMPLIGWTPKSRAIQGSFPVSLYGAQQDVDPWHPEFGNGLHTDGTPITGNDPHVTCMEIGPTFVQDWLAHLMGKYGTAAAGGVKFYNLDNEPMLWNSSHRDVHPQPLGYDELLSRTLAYAAAIKQSDPQAQTLGPVFWGWTAYFYSALDTAPGGAWWTNPQDRNAHGGAELTAWYLQKLHEYEQAHAVRLLDYLDLHYYPQASGVTLSGAGSSATQTLRLRSTRALWDAAYTDESWIAEPVKLIPRMKAWVAANYPGTKLALTEYNWGAPEHINGALAQADVLGIFGREGLDLATMWSPPTATQPVAYAFRMYRNYDGTGRTFGETSLPATSGDQAALAIYAARRAGDGALTIMVINKTASDQTTSLTLSGLHGYAISANVWRYSAANPSAIVTAPPASVAGGKLTTTYPANSITLLELKPSNAARRGWELY